MYYFLFDIALIEMCCLPELCKWKTVFKWILHLSLIKCIHLFIAVSLLFGWKDSVWLKRLKILVLKSYCLLALISLHISESLLIFWPAEAKSTWTRVFLNTYFLYCLAFPKHANGKCTFLKPSSIFFSDLHVEMYIRWILLK